MKNNSEAATFILLIIIAVLFAFTMGAEHSGATDRFIEDAAETIYANSNNA